ncbi:MAG TPA: ankyrin repeat domain-containing protein, partial [Gemmataceae bacterium]|nr:ankyrin repeat domain-containing protein [Gemmataceae bacterium]
MRPVALLPVAAVLLAAGCQKAETTRAVAAPVVLAAAPAAPRTASQPAAPAADGYAARTKQLLEAAERGRVSQLLELLQKGANVNDKDDDGRTALHRAAARGHKSALIALLAMGADMGEKDGKGRTPLMTAAEAGNAEVVTLLVAPGTVASLAGEVFKSAGGAKLPAGLDKLGGLLERGAGDALDQTDLDGRTALMLAAGGGHAACVKALLGGSSHGTNRERVLRPDKKGRNALMLAAAGGHVEGVDALYFWAGDALTATDLRRAGLDGKTALDLAEAGSHKSVVRLLRIAVARGAAFEGDLATLEKYPGVAAPDLMKRAARGGGLPVVKHLMGQYKGKPAGEKLRLVGAFAPEEMAYTALHEAMMNRHLAVVTALIDPDWWQDKAALITFIRFKP